MSPAGGAGGAAHATLREISARLKAESPADTMACAYGVGDRILASYDESDGRFFDLASLTKPLFTAPTVLELIDDDEALDAPVALVLDWLGDRAARLSVRDLLRHSAGLPAELPADRDESAVRAWARAQVGQLGSPTERVLYSDVGYWVLGRLAETLVGRPLHQLFEQSPSGSTDGMAFGGVPAGRAVPAGPICSGVQEVHDPAARRLGACGHAGAFGTLDAVVAAVLSWLRGPWADDAIADQARTCQTHLIPGGHRSLAWTLAGDPFHAVAHDWPESTLCHTGFTGVSVAWDPGSRWWAVLLTNAIPVDRDATPVLIARRLFHALAARELRGATIHDTLKE